MFGSLRNRRFALLWSGQTVSRMGDSVYRIALAWWILERTHSATAMGAVMVFSFVPTILFSLIGGATVDRLPRLPLMLSTDLIRGLVVMVLGFLNFGGRLEVWHVYVASVAFGSVEAFFQPAYASVIPELVPREGLPSANALTSLSGHGSNIAGSALGAWAVSMGGPSLAFGLDGASFFVSAAFLLPLLRTAPTRPRQSSPGFTRDIGEGLRFVMSSPWLWMTITLVALGNITVSAPLKVSLPFLVNENFHAEVGSLGVFYAALAAGAILGTILFSRTGNRGRRGLVAYSVWMTGGLVLAAFGLPIGMTGVCVAAVCTGAAFAVFNIIWTTTLQESVPAGLLGRVSSIDSLGSYALVPLGYSAAGWATDRIGPARVFLIAGLLTVLLAVPGFAQRAVRQIE